MRTLFEQCPVCGGPFVISRVRCTDCSTEIRGEFAPSGLAGLSDEQMTFVKVFLRARGNLSEVEKTLGVSYPTIRNKLDGLIRALDKAEGEAASRAGAAPQSQKGSNAEPEDERGRILARVSAGEITPMEGLDLLSRLSQSPKGGS